MFRRLRERIAEEANRFPVAQNFGGVNALRPHDAAGRSSEHDEDLITLSDSSAVIDPLPQQFSIAGDEDASFSDPNSPQKKANSSAGSELYSTPNSKSMLDANSVTSSNRSSAPSYIPQTDIESEMEEPPTLNLDGISKEQLLSTIDILKAKLCKYKNKYSEVVKAYKNLNEEKKKLEHALTENQDKSLRRIAELREQCQLEQKAKAHLEENLRLILEEKDSRISVLETQINLLKEGQSDQSSFAPKEPERSSDNEQNELSDVPLTPENSALQEKVQKLQALLKECKVTILSKTEHITELSREKEVLCQKIVTLSKSSEEFEEKEANIRMEYENIIEGLKSRLTELEQQQEDSIMSMAETKKNMHEELELKERQLVKAKEDARQFQLAVEHEKAVNAELRKQHDEKIKDLQNQLETTEKVMEEGKQTLIRELSRGKAEAVALIQQESVKKVAALEEEWSAKLHSLEMKLEEFKNKDEGCTNILKEKEEELLSAVRELDVVKEKLQVIEEEKSTLESRVKELESEASDLKTSSEERMHAIEVLTSKLREQECLTTKYQEDCHTEKTRLLDMAMDVSLLKRELNYMCCRNKKCTLSERKQLSMYKERIEMLMNEKEFTHAILERALKDRNMYKIFCCENGEILRDNARLHTENYNLKQNVSVLESELLEVSQEFNSLASGIDKLVCSVNTVEKHRSLVETITQQVGYIENENMNLKSTLTEIQSLSVLLLNNLDSLHKGLKDMPCKSSYSSDVKSEHQVKEMPPKLCLEQSLPAEEDAESDLCVQDNCGLPVISQNELIDASNKLEGISSTSAKIDEMRNIFQKLNHKLKHTLDKNCKLEAEFQSLKVSAELSAESKELQSAHGKASSKKASKKSRIRKKKRGNLESIQEVDDSDLPQATSEGEPSAYNRCTEEITAISCQAETFQNLLDQVEEENSEMQREITMLKQWAENCEVKYVSEIASLHKYLNDAREECSNLGMVLQSLESEIEARNNSTDVALDESGSRLQVSYLKSLIHDMQRREVGLSNLLQKTKSRYENEIAKMNSELVIQMETINSQTDYLNNELQSLKDHLKESHKKYAVEREHLLQQVSCRNFVLEQLRNVVKNVSDVCNKKVAELQDKIVYMCETYNEKISKINCTVLRNMKILLLQCKAFHELQKIDVSFNRQFSSVQKFNSMMSELDECFKSNMISSLKSKITDNDGVFDKISDVLSQCSLADIYSRNVVDVCCDFASMDSVIYSMKEKLSKYESLYEKFRLPVGDTTALFDFVDSLSLQNTQQLEENRKLKLNLINLSKSVRVQKYNVKELKSALENMKNMYGTALSDIFCKVAQLIAISEESMTSAREQQAQIAENDHVLETIQMRFDEMESEVQEKEQIIEQKEKEIHDLQSKQEGLLEQLEHCEMELNTVKKHMAAENCSISSKLEKIEERYQEEISKLKYDISQLEEEKHRLSSDHELRIAAMGDELKIKLDEQATEFLSKLQSKDDELIQIQSESEKNENKLKDVLQELKQETERRFSELSSELKSKENELKELQTEAENRDKELRETIRNLRADLEEKQNYTAELSSRLDSKEMELIHIQAETKKSEDELKETIHKLQTDLNGKHNEVSQLSEELKTKEENLKHVQGQSQKEVKELKDAIQKLQEEVRAEQSQSGLLSELESKTSKLRQELCESEDREMKLNETLLKLHADLKDKESALDLLEKELSSVKATDSVKMDEFNKKIKQLEHEREQLMLQAQERVAATELKYREDIAQLQEKVQDLLIQNKEIAKLKSENSKLSYQLDESLLVAASNQSAATSEMSKLKEQLQQLTEQLSEKDKLCCEKDEELNRTVSDLQGLKEEKEILNQQLKSIELEVAHAKDLEERVSSLQHENKSLRSELDSLTVLKQEKDNLNAKISSLEHSKKDMAETIKLLKSENENLRTKESSLNQEVSSLKSERESLANKLQESETSNSECLECASLKSSIDELHSEYEKKLELKDAEMEDKVKLVIKEFYSQMNIKDSDCDQTISELIDCSKGIEEKLQKEHRLEIAALRQDIFEKDCALEEMHEHYEGIIKEKDALINEYEKNLKAANAVKNFELPNAEASDWDDTWAVPEESCENISPAHSNNVDCDKHKEEIENLREELEKCNTELKDLRILLRLTPPQSLHSNNNYSSLIPISEPTEFEYLKNILFQYMMGRETVILVKVIAAVLRFSDEQTRLVVEREKSKPQSK